MHVPALARSTTATAAKCRGLTPPSWRSMVYIIRGGSGGSQQKNAGMVGVSFRIPYLIVIVCPCGARGTATRPLTSWSHMPLASLTETWPTTHRHRSSCQPLVAPMVTWESPPPRALRLWCPRWRRFLLPWWRHPLRRRKTHRRRPKSAIGETALAQAPEPPTRCHPDTCHNPFHL